MKYKAYIWRNPTDHISVVVNWPKLSGFLMEWVSVLSRCIHKPPLPFLSPLATISFSQCNPHPFSTRPVAFPVVLIGHGFVFQRKQELIKILNCNLNAM